MKVRAIQLLLLNAMLVATVVGCGGDAKTGTITGKIQHQGKPLQAGEIHCYGSDGLDHPANINQDGTYTIPNMPVGPCTIVVIQPPANTESDGQVIKVTGARNANVKIGSAEEAAANMGIQQRRTENAKFFTAPNGVKTLLPVKYATRETTDLKSEIKPGETTKYDIELK